MPVRARPEERREHEHADAARERAVEVDAAALCGGAQADGEQHDGEQHDHPEPVGQQRGAPAAASKAAAGAGLTGRCTAARTRGMPLIDEAHRRAGRLPEQLGREPGRAGAHLQDVGVLRHGRGQRLQVDVAEAAGQLDGPLLERRLVAHGHRPRLAVVAVQERLREGADDDPRLTLSLPVAVVEPGDVAVAEPVLRRAAVALVAVDEPEPVALLVQAPLDAVDRLDEAPAVARLDVGLRGERRISVWPASTSASTSSSAPRSRVTQSCAVPSSPPAAPPQPARRSESGKRGERAPDHCWAFDRTAPGATARTSPACLPMQARPAVVLNRLPSATSVAVAARERFPASVTDSTT